MINDRVLYAQNGKKNKFLGIPCKLDKAAKQTLLQLHAIKRLAQADDAEAEQQKTKVDQLIKDCREQISILLDKGYLVKESPIDISHIGELLCQSML